MPRIALLLALALLAGPAAAATIDDCEKISAPDAYNRCLASFGPKRGQRPPPGAQPRDHAPRPAVAHGLPRHRAHFGPVRSVLSFRRTPSGRVTMQFDIRPRGR